MEPSGCPDASRSACFREYPKRVGKRDSFPATEDRRKDIPGGYAFRLPTDSAMLLKVAAYISNERLSCAFIHFTLEVEPYGGPFWLRLTGGEGVKEYMRSVFETHDLLNERVARAAGLR